MTGYCTRGEHAGTYIYGAGPQQFGWRGTDEVDNDPFSWAWLTQPVAEPWSWEIELTATRDRVAATFQSWEVNCAPPSIVRFAEEYLFGPPSARGEVDTGPSALVLAQRSEVHPIVLRARDGLVEMLSVASGALMEGWADTRSSRKGSFQELAQALRATRYEMAIVPSSGVVVRSPSTVGQSSEPLRRLNSESASAELCEIVETIANGWTGPGARSERRLRKKLLARSPSVRDACHAIWGTGMALALLPRNGETVHVARPLNPWAEIEALLDGGEQ